MTLLKIAWIGLLVEVIVFNLIKPIINNFEVAAIYFIGINIVFVAISISKNDKKTRFIFYLAYIIRILAMFWDIYARSIFMFPSSGGDSEGFLLSATQIADNPDLFKSNIYGGLYSKILGALFYVTAPERLLGQYVNVLLGLTIITVVYEILTLLDVNEKTKMLSILLICFFPNSIVLSAVLLRENFIVTFVIISFYFFVKWYEGKQNRYMIYSIIFVLLASSFHSGVIGIIVGYIFMYMFYKHDVDELKFNNRTIFVFILFSIMSYVIYVRYADIFMSKFNKVEELQDIYDTANSRRGGSMYLTQFKIDKWWKMILFSPIKCFYFLTSPLPMDWRGVNDITAFLVDGFIYLCLIVYSFRNFSNVDDRKPLLIGISVILLVTIFIFGIGVSNAGTAMRHRHKIFPIIVIFCAVISDCKKMVIEQSKYL